MLAFRILVLLNLLFQTCGNKILALLPHRGRSQSIPLLALTKTLAEKDHQVSAISHFPQETSPPNYSNTQLKISKELNFAYSNLRTTKRSRKEMWSVLSVIDNFSKLSCNDDFTSATVRNLVIVFSA